MTPLAFAWRSLVRQPARAVLGIAGVTVVGALLFDMLLLSRGLQVSFEELLDSVGFDVRVLATDAPPGAGPLVPAGVELTRRIAELPEVDAAVGFRFGRAALVDGEGREIEAELIGSTGPARDTWSIVEGRDVAFGAAPGEREAVVNRRLAERLQLSPGDVLSLRGTCREGPSALPAVRLRVTGVAAFRFENHTSLTALTDLDGLVAACDLDEAGALDLLLVATAAGRSTVDAVEAVRALGPGLHVFSNRQLVERLEATNFSYFRQVSFALSVVTLSFAFLLTATLLTVSVNQRLAEVAGLRALGFPRRRVVADLLCESALLVGGGGLLSLPLGGLFAARLDAILREMPGLPERLHFFVFQPRALVLHLVLLLAAGGLAAVYPMVLAARLPIAATLRKETVS